MQTIYEANKLSQEENQDTIPRKIAAIEVINHIKKEIALGLSVIVGTAFSAFLSFYNIYAGCAIVAIFSVIAAFSLKNSFALRNDLKYKYNIEIPKTFNIKDD